MANDHIGQALRGLVIGVPLAIGFWAIIGVGVIVVA
jgi:hypothetical protein